MKITHNPFRYGADFNSGDLVGREDEVAHVKAVIRNGMRLFLIGARRFGKTSILRAAQEDMVRKGFIVIYVNAEATPAVSSLIEEIVAGAVTQGLNMKVYTPLNSSASRYEQIRRLAGTLDALDSQAGKQQEDRSVTLIIDEFSSLMTRFGVMAEAELRSVVQTHQNLGYIFAGSNVGLMMDMVGKYSRPFYHGGSIYYLRSVPTGEFAAWIQKQFRESGFHVEGDEPIQRVLALAEEVPYNVQMLAHNCWNALHGQAKPTLAVDLVEVVLKRTVIDLDSTFSRSWNRLTSLQQQTLIEVLRGNGEPIKPAHTARSINCPASSVCSALRALYDREILWNDLGAKKYRVRLVDPFFGHWIRMAVPALPPELISAQPSSGAVIS